MRDILWFSSVPPDICCDSTSNQAKSHFFALRSLYIVLYGCETWSLTQREEGRLRVFENRVMGRIFGPKRDEVIVE